MRIWSLHPKYLDAKGLVALWRETLLAQYVLKGLTKAYKNHPQLSRFKLCSQPVDAIDHYLSEVYFEASRRNYNFDRNKINWEFIPAEMRVTTGQLDYEVKHLIVKLKIRDQIKYGEIKKIKRFAPHPVFKLADGEIEDWEIL